MLPSSSRLSISLPIAFVASILLGLIVWPRPRRRSLPTCAPIRQDTKPARLLSVRT